MRKILSVILVLLLFLMFTPLNVNAKSNLSVITFVITPNSVDSYGEYLIDMQVTSDLSTNDYIYINFPTGFVLPQNISSSLVTINGEPVSKVEISSMILKIYLNSSIQKNTEIVIQINKKAMIRNPNFPNDYGFLIGLSNEPSPQNKTVTIKQGITHLSIITQPNTSNSPAMYLINFYTSATGGLNGSNGDYITIAFSADVYFAKNQISVDDILVNGIKANSINLNNNILTIHLDTGVVIPPSSFVSIQILADAGITNPKLPGNYFISVLTNKDPFFANTVYEIKGTSVKNLQVTLNPRIQNAFSEIKVSFITSSAGMLEKGKDEVFVEFPDEFSFQGASDFSKIKINGVNCETGKINQKVLSITLPVDVKNGTVTVIIDKSFGIRNPLVKGEYALKIYTSKDLTPVSFYVQIEASHITAPIVSLTNFGATSVSGYTIIFYTGAGGTLTKGKDSITILFPEGTYLPQTIAKDDIKVNDVTLLENPITNENSLIVKVPISIQGDEKVTVKITDKAGLKNPESGGIYTLTVFTSQETTPAFSVAFEISLLPKSFANITPTKPDGKNDYYITHPIVTLSAESPTDPNPAIYYYIDENSPTLYNGEKISIADGAHTLFYYAIDHMGHKESKVNSIAFKVDTIPPEVTITSPSSNSVSGASVKLIGKTEKNAAIQINGDVIPIKPDGSFETILTGQGTKTFVITITDEAGNTSQKNITITFNSEPATPPSLTIISPQDGTIVYEQSIVVTGQTDVGAQVQVNGEKVDVSENGSFTKTVQLVSNENTIDIKATKNGQVTEKKILVKYVKAISMKLQIGNKNAIVNGEVVSLDSPPVIIKNRTLVPLRVISESFGADVKWDPVLRIVEINFGSTDIKLQIGSNKASVNGKEVTLDVPPQIINGRTMVPLRFIVESFNANVAWDPDTRTITITYP